MEKVLLVVIAASVLCGVSLLTVRQYHFVYEKKNWTEALSYCRKKYTDLVTVDNMEVVEILNNMADLEKMKDDNIDYRAWIGLSKDVNSWRWSMSDRLMSETDFTNWLAGQPNNHNNVEECVLMHPTGLWSDKSCEKTYPLICSEDKGQAVKFIYINKAMTWTEAQSYCRKHFTDLASVRNMTENQQVMEQLPSTTGAWIGLFRDSWKWTDGRNFSFSYWRESEPNSAEELCASAHFEASGKWEDVRCSATQVFICYRDPVPSKQVVMRVKLRRTSSLDLNEPPVLENLLKKFKQKLKDRGVKGDIKLSWRKQSPGKIFTKDEL